MKRRRPVRLCRHKIVTLDVDEYQGAAGLAASLCFEGWQFLKMERQGRKVRLIYVR